MKIHCVKDQKVFGGNMSKKCIYYIYVYTVPNVYAVTQTHTHNVYNINYNMLYTLNAIIHLFNFQSRAHTSILHQRSTPQHPITITATTEKYQYIICWHNAFIYFVHHISRWLNYTPQPKIHFYCINNTII